jgi:transposase-like protein
MLVPASQRFSTGFKLRMTLQATEPGSSVFRLAVTKYGGESGHCGSAITALWM